MRTVRLLRSVLPMVGLIAALPDGCMTHPTGPMDKINHVIVVYQENWSFDGLYGNFPHANGRQDALKLGGGAISQVDEHGTPYRRLPRPIYIDPHPPWQTHPDLRFPAQLAMAPFDITGYVPPDQKTGDLVHRFDEEQLQIDGGKMDQFVLVSNAKGLAMSYYDAKDLPEGKLAQDYTMADHFFHAAFGGSFLNHVFLICACVPVWPNAPPTELIHPRPDGSPGTVGQVTADGHVVNTSFSVNTPHPADKKMPGLVPNQTAPTIGDRLNDKHVSWAWYSGGWNQALAGAPHKDFQFHHQPFVYFANFADGTKAKKEHLKDEADFFRDLVDHTLPAVAFVKPLGPDNEHPGYADLLTGQQHVADIVTAVQRSRYGTDTTIIIAYDENGGRWDHVAPPTGSGWGDRWGPGTRVPAIIISYYAKKRFVDPTPYDTTSILKFITRRFDLESLPGVRANMGDLTNAFDFSGESDNDK